MIQPKSQTAWSRLGWFFALWLAGVSAVTLVGLVVRAWLG